MGECILIRSAPQQSQSVFVFERQQNYILHQLVQGILDDSCIPAHQTSDSHCRRQGNCHTRKQAFWSAEGWHYCYGLHRLKSYQGVVYIRLFLLYTFTVIKDNLGQHSQEHRRLNSCNSLAEGLGSFNWPSSLTYLSRMPTVTSTARLSLKLHSSGPQCFKHIQFYYSRKTDYKY